MMGKLYCSISDPGGVYDRTYYYTAPSLGVGNAVYIAKDNAYWWAVEQDSLIRASSILN